MDPKQPWEEELKRVTLERNYLSEVVATFDMKLKHVQEELKRLSEEKEMDGEIVRQMMNYIEEIESENTRYVTDLKNFERQTDSTLNISLTPY
jgi:hypothetical protein